MKKSSKLARLTGLDQSDDQHRDLIIGGSPIIFKYGDDLRQDMACLQIFRFFNYIWKEDGLVFANRPVYAREYGCAAISPAMGVIEYVMGCVSLNHIKKVKWEIESIERLISTAAGSYIAAYILGIRDRHADNILIHTDGSLFHIDFGHVLGDKVTIDTGAFAITPGLMKVMGERGWYQFVGLCVKAFYSLRKRTQQVIDYCSLMLSSFVGRETVETFLHSVLHTDKDAGQATASVRGAITSSPKDYKTRLKNRLHNIANSLK